MTQEYSEKPVEQSAEQSLQEERTGERREWALRIFGLLCFISAFILGSPVFHSGVLWLRPFLFIAAWLFIGGGVILRAFKNISRGEIFDENFLMTAATIGAFAIGEFPEGAAVMLFYRVGEAFQDLAVRRSRSSITSLMDLRPAYAMLKRDGALVRVDPGEVHPGDCIVVRPGEKIALDGIVEDGESLLDTSAMTGEPLPRRVRAGTEVLAGMINQTGLLGVRVTREAGESAAAKILRLVKEAEDKKAPAENFITRFARYYTPAVVFSALALAVLPPLVTGIAGGMDSVFSGGPDAAANVPDAAAGAFAGFTGYFSAAFPGWLRRALVFLVVSCPCALVVSIPLSFFGGIGGASRRGILVKGGNYLDALNNTGAVVFDKTGTLTKGSFTVTKIIPAAGKSGDEVLRLASLAESNSNHPIALSIREAAARRGCVPEEASVASCSEIAGKGVRLTLKDGRILRAGSKSFLEEEGIVCGNADGPGTENSPKSETLPGTTVWTAENNTYTGLLIAADELRNGSRETLTALKEAGIRTVMLTGDQAAAARTVAAEAGIEEFHAELLPWEKVDKLEALKKELGTAPKRNKVVFVGDGINDAPVLTASDIGIAMGGLGSDAAIESADIVLMTDEPGKIVEALAAARKTRSVVRQNIVFALGVKAALLVLGALGIASLWAAVFGDVGVALIAVLNAARTYRY